LERIRRDDPKIFAEAERFISRQKQPAAAASQSNSAGTLETTFGCRLPERPQPLADPHRQTVNATCRPWRVERGRWGRLPRTRCRPVR
jgi:hypothetical protein